MTTPESPTDQSESVATTTQCPVCRRTTEVPERYRNKRWRCPACRTGLLALVGKTAPLLDESESEAVGALSQPKPPSRTGRRLSELAVAALIGAAITAVLFTYLL